MKLARVTLEWTDGNVKFVFHGKRDNNGLKQGSGSLTLFDLSSPDESFVTYSGHFCDDVLEGPGELFYSDGRLVKGTFVDGEITCDRAEEYADGRRLYIGQYRNSERHGMGILYVEDGGIVEGEFDDGDIVRSKCEYIYPTSTIRIRCPEACENDLETCRLTADKLEQERVYVSQSSLPSAGEGLFAAVDIAAGQLCCYYNGLVVPDAEVQKWDFTKAKNAIYLDDGMDLDVPPPYDDKNYYCATLGHKANHDIRSRRNASYDRAWHPRFGDIRCIRAVKDIAKDEEILVDYTYSKEDQPEWWPKNNDE
jgi:histone-lysine N-methyltransferase SETD7